MLVCVFLWRVVFTGAALLPGDYLYGMQPWKSVSAPRQDIPQWNPLQYDAIAQFYPWRVFYSTSMRNGSIPLWNPHQFCGTPFLANGQSAVLYPGNLLFLLFDPVTAFTLSALLHLFLAQAFTYLLLRELRCGKLASLIGGVTFAFCAFVVVWLELPTFVNGAIWLPLALLLVHRAVERRSMLYGSLAGLAVAMPVLAGHLQIAFYVGLATAAWAVWRIVINLLRTRGAGSRPGVIVPAVVCMSVAILIVCAQVLPSVELSGNSHRVRSTTSEGYDKFIANALQPYRLVTAFCPDFYGSPAKSNYTLLGFQDRHPGSAADYMEYGMYAGVPGLVLAVISLVEWRRRGEVAFFAIFGALALLTAAGTWINLVFYYLTPGFSALGGPNRIIVLYLFSVAMLAGFGADWVLHTGSGAATGKGKPPLAKAALVACGALGLAFLCTDPIARGALTRFAALDSAVSASVALESETRFLAALAITLAVLLLYAFKLLGKPTFAWLLPALVVADLFSYGANYNPTCRRDQVYPNTPLTDTLKRIAGTERIIPINPKWSLFAEPDAILPPNAAMVYGLYDVQGYDSLYMRNYTGDFYQCPPENGNMVLVPAFTPEMSWDGRYVLSTSAIESRRSTPAPMVGQFGGVKLYRLDYDGFHVPTAEYPGWDKPYRKPASTVAYQGPNQVTVAWKSSAHQITMPTRYYPGWTAYSQGRHVAWSDESPVPDTRDELRGATFRFEPFSFRLGLFLSLLGCAVLSYCVVSGLLARRGAR